MKKLKFLGVTLLFIAIIVAVLFYNKSKIAAKSKPNTTDIYFVSVKNVSKQKISENYSFVGTVNANNDVNIISETSGKITAVFAKVGDYKSAGSVLFQVDDELKKAAFITAEANYLKAKKDYERVNALYKQKSVTDSQNDAAMLAYVAAESQYIISKRQLNDTKITTPISGIVSMRNVNIGTMIQGPPQNTLVANIVDISKLKIKVNVSEKDVFKLKVGDKVEAFTEIFPSVKYDGKVETISPKGDDAHTFPVEVVINNNNKYPLKAGLFAKVNFQSLEKNEFLSIPRDAVVGSIKNPQVYVVKDGVARLKDVVLGVQFKTFIEVLGGLEEGESIVVNGQTNLVNNAKVEIVNE